MTATQALVQAIAPGSPLGLPPQAVLDKIDSAKIAALLKPAVTGAPIDVTLVGDIDERTAVQLVADSLGALPPRTRRASEPSRASYMRFPASAPAPIRALHHGPADKALGQLIWPLWVAVPSRRREEYTVDVLVNIFNNELRRRVRGELGKTYSPTVTSETPDNADQGRMVADIESYPGDLEPLMTEARAVARRLASGAISAEQLEAARAPMLAEDHRQMQTNAHWAEALSGSAEDDQNLKDELDFADMVGSLSLDEVRKVAADWLSQAPVEVLVQPASAQPKLAQAGP
jgi:zinc protease